MTLEEEIIEAADKHDAYHNDQMVDMLKNMPWKEIDGRYYLTSKDIDPCGLVTGVEPTVIAHKWYYSVDAVMARMKKEMDRYGSLFRNSVIAKIGGGIKFHYPKDSHGFTRLLSTLDEQAYIIFEGKRLHVVPLMKEKDGTLRKIHDPHTRTKTTG